MPAIFTSALLFAFLMAAISYYGYRRYARPGRIYEQLANSIEASPPENFTKPTSRATHILQIFRRIGDRLPISPLDAGLRRRYLIAAGYRSETAVQIFYGIKVVLAVSLFLVVFLLRGYIHFNFILRTVLLATSAFAGYFGPNLFLERLVGKRQEELRLALPDALDLMVVCAEAGLALDQAILNVSRELKIAHKAICQELSIVTLEIFAGKRRAEALRNFADRTGEDEIRKLVAILIQTDRFGTSMGDSLRTQSDFLRTRRRQDAEERAGKVGVKLIFPIFFFSMPSMLVVAAGPGILQIFKNLFPLMKQF